MHKRTITDDEGREWVCTSKTAAGAKAGDKGQMGIDVTLSCTTPSLPEPVVITVGWNWEQMSENGLARMVSQAADDAS